MIKWIQTSRLSIKNSIPAKSQLPTKSTSQKATYLRGSHTSKLFRERFQSELPPPAVWRGAVRVRTGSWTGPPRPYPEYSRANSYPWSHFPPRRHCLRSSLAWCRACQLRAGNTSTRLIDSGLTSLGGVPREQKMLTGHLPRVIYHQVY